MWVSKEAVAALSDIAGFGMLEQQVDSHGVFEWTLPAEKAAVN